MTPAWLEAIKRRCSDASPGPWETYVYGMHAGAPDAWRLVTGADSTTFDHEYDAEFCAHARADVPALLALVEAMAASLTVEPGHCCRECDWPSSEGHLSHCSTGEALARYQEGPR